MSHDPRPLSPSPAHRSARLRDGIQGLVRRFVAAVTRVVAALVPRLGLWTVLAAAAAPALDAQVVRGRLLEAYTDRPIEAADVALASEDGRPLANAITDAGGHFHLAAPGAGRFLLQAQRLGYRSALEGPFDLGARDTLRVEFRIQLQPIELDSLHVAAEARSPRLERTGFYERRRRQPGHFITREEIERKQPVDAFSLFRALPGVHVIVRGNASSAVILRGGFGHSLQNVMCYPRVYLDGVLVGRSSAADVLRDLDPWRIEAIEIYRSPAEVPAQYGGTSSGCGVILLWTR